MAESWKNTEFVRQSPTKSNRNMQGLISPTRFEALAGWVCSHLKQVFSTQAECTVTLSTSALARHKLPEQLEKVFIFTHN